jgi:hypothetical protein
MGETSNISIMAELLSKDLFTMFKWERVGPININWSCQNDHHKKKTHPSDVVLCYPEPYRNRTTYVNCDLKSYAKGSIAAGSIINSIENLALAVECANVSQDWQKQYLKYNESNAEIVGLLFIYNHDGLFDKDFDRMIREAAKDKINIPKNVKVFVLGPRDICYLNTVVNDVKRMIADEVIPVSSGDRCFYYPDLYNEKVMQKDWSVAATLETLTGPWQMIKYKKANSSEHGIVIYCKDTGDRVEEFIYLIDYLFHYQILQNYSDIRVKLPNASSHAASVFTHALKQYTARYEGHEELVKRLESLSYEPVTNVISTFNETEIGMRL